MYVLGGLACIHNLKEGWQDLTSKSDDNESASENQANFVNSSAKRQNILGSDKKRTVVMVLGFMILGIVITLYLSDGYIPLEAYEIHMPILFKDQPELSNSDTEGDSSSAGTKTSEERDEFSIVLGVLHDPIKQEQIQVASITAYDANDHSWLEGVTIEGTISKGQKKIQSFDGVTDENGRLTYSWKIEKNLDPGLYVLNAHGLYQHRTVGTQSLYFLVEPSE